MNERIEELFDKALDIAVPETWTTLDPEQMTRIRDAFAELIVRECADYALEKGKASPDTDFRTGSLVISEFLLAHFGVEE